MFAKIVEISTVDGWDETYVEVEFWDDEAGYRRGEPPVLLNSFIMQLRAAGHGPVQRADGRYEAEDGSLHSKADLQAMQPAARPRLKREAKAIDVGARIRANIDAYAARAKARGERGDKRDRTVKRSARRDPHGVLARDDVKTLGRSTFRPRTR